MPEGNLPEPAAPEHPGHAHRPAVRRRRTVFVVILVALALFAGWTAYILMPHADSPVAAVDGALSETACPAHNPDEQLRRLAIGTWHDEYEGKRTMILKEDGTGTMVVELSGIKAMLSAPRLRFDMTWAVENGRLQKHTVGGEPASTVQLILKTMGDRVDEPILELNQGRLLLLDKDGKTKYDWRRQADSPEAK